MQSEIGELVKIQNLNSNKITNTNIRDTRERLKSVWLEVAQMMPSQYRSSPICSLPNSWHEIYFRSSQLNVAENIGWTLVKVNIGAVRAKLSHHVVSLPEHCSTVAEIPLKLMEPKSHLSIVFIFAHPLLPIDVSCAYISTSRGFSLPNIHQATNDNNLALNIFGGKFALLHRFLGSLCNVWIRISQRLHAPLSWKCRHISRSFNWSLPFNFQ